jgi:chromosome segregation ATPase
MNINDKFITSFFRVCVKLYNYNGDSDNDIEIKNLNEFITKCNEKISIIEDNEALNVEITDLSKQINKITLKYNETEKKYVNLYNDLRDCRIELKSSNEEKEKIRKNVDKLFLLKTKYEKDIELKNQQLKQIQKKYNDNKAFWKKLLIDLEEKNNNYHKENKELSEQNNKYIDEINKIEEFKKTLCNRLSSDTIEKIDVSIVDMIERANEYEKKYKELSTQNNILKNNYDDLNDKYKELISNQTNETNELKRQIKSLTEQIENERKQYNDNIIVMETKNKIIENLSSQKGGNEENIKYIDIRDKKAIGHFEKDILLFNEKNDENKYKEPTNRYKGENISYSTDYMVDLLKVSEKVKPQIKKNTNNNLGTIEEIEITESDESEINKNNSIFLKNNVKDNYIDIRDMKILNESDEIKNNKKGLKKELDDFIVNNRNNNNEDINNIVYVGGGKKNKIEIRQIDEKYKMKFDGEFSTLTEQNINLNDEKAIKKIRHRKYMRHIREKNKLDTQ